MAVTGFLQLLAYIKITDPGSLSLSSSSSQSTHSLLTQLSLSRAGNFAGNSLSGESLALEILNILKRCFMQQAEVTEYLYEGILLQFFAIITNFNARSFKVYIKP